MGNSNIFPGKPEKGNVENARPFFDIYVLKSGKIMV